MKERHERTLRIVLQLLQQAHNVRAELVVHRLFVHILQRNFSYRIGKRQNLFKRKSIMNFNEYFDNMIMNIIV